MIRRVLRVVGVATLAAGLAGFATTIGASAQTTPGTGGPLAISARADSLQVQIIASGLPSVPNGEITAASPSSAQASLDATSSQAFASAPNPGDLVVSLPSTVNGLAAGQAPPLPSYPLVVSTSNPTTPTASQTVGPYQLSASSSESASTADARVGLATFSPQVVSATSHSTVSKDPHSGLMVAEATTEIAPFRLNDLVAVGEIRGTAKLTYDPNNPSAGVKKQTSLSVASLIIAGIEVGLTDKGLTLAGTPLVPVDLSALTKLLGATGVSLAYAPKTETATSVQSAGIQVLFNKTFPDPFSDTTVKLALGQASASLSPGDVVPADQASSNDTGNGAVAPSSAGGSGAGGLAPSSGSPDATGSAPSGATPSATSPRSSRRAAPAMRRLAATSADTSSFYLILVVAGLVALACSRLTQWSALRARLAPALARTTTPHPGKGASP
jgi:hypothetical protein